MSSSPDQCAEIPPLAHAVTIYVAQAKKVLANAPTHRIICETVANLKRWRVHAGVTLPDRCRFIISSWESADVPAADFVAGFKMMMRRNLLEHFDESDRSEPLVHVLWEWQKDFSHTSLATEQEVSDATRELQTAPVWEGLVPEADGWGYRI